MVSGKLKNTIIGKAQSTKVGGSVNQPKPELIKARYQPRIQSDDDEPISSSGEEDDNNHDTIIDSQNKLNDSNR